MGWLDGILDGAGDLFGGSDWNFGDGGGGGWWNSDWLGGGDGDWSDLVDWTFGGDDNGFNFDWGSLSGTGGGSSGGGWLSTIGNLFGGGSGSGQGGGNIWGSLLSGLNGAASAYMSDRALEKGAAETGKQQRLTLGYKAELDDYYGQLDKQRKRIALDTYGQFSLLDRNKGIAPAVQVPNKPSPGG